MPKTVSDFSGSYYNLTNGLCQSGAKNFAACIPLVYRMLNDDYSTPRGNVNRKNRNDRALL